MPWDADRYHLFSSQRSEPFEDLLALVHIRPGLQVVDLGCGSGELTRRLADALPDSEVLGIDSSPEMLARTMDQARPGLRYALRPIQDLQGAWDLIFSNAALQWLDDHPRLVPWLFSLVRPAGQLVVQMPSNHNHPAHRLLAATAQEEPFRQALGGWRRQSPVLSIEAYAQILYDCGGKELVVLEKIYPHVLPGAESLLEWASGTAMIPYLDRLPVQLHQQFTARYRQRLEERWPVGPVFYPFRRILIAAVR